MGPGDEEPASRRTWRTVTVAVLLTLPAFVVLMHLVFEAPPLGEQLSGRGVRGGVA